MIPVVRVEEDKKWRQPALSTFLSSVVDFRAFYSVSMLLLLLEDSPFLVKVVDFHWLQKMISNSQQ
jgi:hypothetical protein